MRLAFVVQRYGPDIAGGAEAFCRDLAERLAARGHHVDVVTSNAVDYVEWAPILPVGTETINGVGVHRLAVRSGRTDELFGPLNARLHSQHAVAPFLQREWMAMQGPQLDGLEPWLAEHSALADVTSFFTYLYHPTAVGLPVSAGRSATVLHPTAHDEPPIYLPLFSLLFRLPHAFGFLTPEEAAFVGRRFRLRKPSVVTGVGIDLSASGDADRFRSRFDLGDSHLLLYAGRIDPHKGAVELLDYFALYRRRNPSPDVKLVLMGEPVRPLEPRDDVVVTGFVDEQTKHDAFQAATIFVQPSFFESFSIVLAEAWAHEKPALVQGRCDVLTGQARRSGGGIPYRGFAEFEAALDLLLADPALRARLGSRGRAYVESNYDWDHVLGTYESFLEDLVERRRRTALRLG